jgi:two-component system LytT family response regulator
VTCLALDDEPLALQLLEAYLLRKPALQPQGFFTDPDAARARLGQGGIDLLFLDIQMPDVTGMEFLRGLPPPPPLVIFTTAHAGFAVEGFNLSAVDYLLKPYDFERFNRAVERAIEYSTFRKNRDAAAAPGSLFVKSGYATVQIPFEHILCLETYDDYVKIHLTDQPKPVLTLSPLKTLLEKLPAGQFLRVHRSYAVSISKVLAFRRGKIHLTDGKEVPVGDTFAARIRELLSKR